MYKNYTTAIFFVLSISIYLFLKNIFWPLHKPISVTILQQKSEIENLLSPLDTSTSGISPLGISQQSSPSLRNDKIEFHFDRINFRESDELFHDNTGYLGFKNNFFMQLKTQFRVNKPGEYLFKATSDDGFWLKIDNKIICEYIAWRAFKTTNCPIILSEGIHYLELYYYQGTGQLGLSLNYQNNENSDDNESYYVGQDSALMSFHLSHRPFNKNYSSPKIERNKLIQQALAGDTATQLLLAEQYLEGIGVKQDMTQAFNWYQLASKSGEPYAQFKLGQLYLQKSESQENINQALYWITLAAKNYNLEAQYYLGMLYFNGRYVDKDQQRAFYWIKKAALGESETTQHPFFVSKKSGHKKAQIQLADMYASGLGTHTHIEDTSFEDK